MWYTHNLKSVAYFLPLHIQNLKSKANKFPSLPLYTHNLTKNFLTYIYTHATLKSRAGSNAT